MITSSFFDVIHERRNTNSVKYGKPPEGKSDNIIPMWIADMDFKSPPSVKDALVQAAEHGIYGYTKTDEGYHDLVTHWYRKRMGWKFNPTDIVIVPSVMFGIASLIRCLTEPLESIIICQPVYHPFASIIRGNNRRLIISELKLINGRYEMDFEDFNEKIKKYKVKAFLLCSPHNPVGRVWTKNELNIIADICLRNNVIIISDEIHCDLVYPGHKHIPMAAISDEISKITVTCLSPTKTFNIAGLQAANIIVTNKQIRKKILDECRSTGYYGLNTMAITAAKAAYNDGEEWLNTLILYLYDNLTLLKSKLSSSYPISITDVEGTYLAWLDCRKLNLSANELDDLFLNKAGIWLNNGRIFGDSGNGFMRMNFACPRSILIKAVERIKGTINNLK